MPTRSISADDRATVGRRPRQASPKGREELLDIAIAMFAEGGIAGTTIAQVAAAADVTPAMVHYWFSSRDRLLDAVVEERIAPEIRKVWAAADMEHDSAAGLVRGLVTRMLEVTRQAPWLPPLWLREIVQLGGLLGERVRRNIPRPLIANFCSRMAAAQARGEINAGIAPDLLIISILGLVMVPQAAQALWREINPGSRVDRAALEQHVITLVMAGLTGVTPGAGRGGER